MDISLQYGREQVKIYLPSENLAGWIRPRLQTESSLQDSLVNLSARVEAADFMKQIQQRRLCVLLPDGTRDFPWNVALPPLFSLFRGAAHISFIVCTGTHTAETQENRAILDKILKQIRRIGLFSYDAVLHDCRIAQFADAGKTAFGTPILYNKLLNKADIFLTLNDVRFHYFAGYSNPVKNFVPGVCAFETAEKNHSLTFDPRSRYGAHPWHPRADRRDHPLAADLLEAMNQIVRSRPVWSLVTLSDKGKLYWARFGPAQEAAAQAFVKADQCTEYFVQPAERMIVSPGGHPEDGDLYIAQRALELTQCALEDGGEILFLAACPNGIGGRHTIENFYNKLAAPLDTILAEKPAQYKLYSHKPYRFAQLIRRLRAFHIHSQLDDRILSAIHMRPTKNPQAVVNGWIDENPLVKILFVDGANKLALHPKT
ncbi:MAG TPA: lactate racemase domain-containing protein [Anaerohalosphaeraceae bacterium]|jgi:nickel-dependent lactate racemase|nr:lactate racemase domain-containing protein [Anaerohalosphaeraceae bacterium]